MVFQRPHVFISLIGRPDLDPTTSLRPEYPLLTDPTTAVDWLQRQLDALYSMGFREFTLVAPMGAPAAGDIPSDQAFTVGVGASRILQSRLALWMSFHSDSHLYIYGGFATGTRGSRLMLGAKPFDPSSITHRNFWLDQAAWWRDVCPGRVGWGLDAAALSPVAANQLRDLLRGCGLLEVYGEGIPFLNNGLPGHGVFNVSALRIPSVFGYMPWESSSTQMLRDTPTGGLKFGGQYAVVIDADTNLSNVTNWRSAGLRIATMRPDLTGLLTP